MMRIIQALAKEHPVTMLRTALRKVQGVMTYEAAVGREEQISIRTSQLAQSIKHYTIYGREDQSREMGL
jgi:hypothetical protein